MYRPMDKALAGVLGLAKRAGHLIPGADFALQSVREGKASLVLIDQLASQNTRKKLLDACNYRDLQVIFLRAELLGQACGHSGLMAAAMIPGGFADKLRTMCPCDTDEYIKQGLLEDKG